MLAMLKTGTVFDVDPGGATSVPDLSALETSCRTWAAMGESGRSINFFPRPECAK
ncbi:hypothetical protein SS05631_c35650 [Sinorhizobium sp. CCBAU 05631]|nr:hypothetical protein SS05631_c35650 [Sinorhizobium sp. CCBAU 05631]